LPDNYSADGTFPLCVYLDGWDGGRGDRPGIARAIVGSRDFICVNMPLFKRAYSTNGGDLGLLITVDDFETVSRAYRMMLQKLFEAVPNITPERSVFGGFSNGAHTTSLLIAGQDELILHHFQAFYFVEGGAFLAANTLEKPSPSMKHFRFLFVHGDYSSGFRNHAIEECAKEQNLDFTTVVMPNTGHAFPPKYMAITGQWIRGEKLPSTAQKE
jgi:predicted esterase